MMRRSFVRLVVSSVLGCWALGFLVAFIYAMNETWSEEEARADGVFFVRELLEREPAPSRAAKLGELKPHFDTDLALLTLEEVEARAGRRPRPGETIHLEVSFREEWYFVAFADGEGALQALSVLELRSLTLAAN